jgi:anti-anti-sigma factor
MSSVIKVIQAVDFPNIAVATQFHAEVAHAIESDVDIVLVDLKQLTSVTSANFIALVKGLKLAHDSECQLFICSVSDQVKMLFELTGLDQVFKLLSDWSDVHQYLQPTNELRALRQAKSHAAPLKLAS